MALARRVGDAGGEVLLQYDAASRLWQLPAILGRREEHPARTVGRLLGDVNIEPGDAHAVADPEQRTIHAVFALAGTPEMAERSGLRWHPIGGIESVTDLAAHLLAGHGIPARASSGRTPNAIRARLHRARVAAMRNWTLAAGGVIENANGEFLLVRNHQSKHSGPPGGLAKWKEAARETARRKVAQEVGFGDIVDWTEFPARSIELPDGTEWRVPGGNTEIDPDAREVRIYQRGNVTGSPEPTPRGVKEAGWVSREDVVGAIRPGTKHLYRTNRSGPK